MELTKVKLSDVARVEISGVDKKSKPGQKSVRLCNFVDVYHNWAITQDMRDSFMEATASDKEIEALSIKKGQVAFTKDSETRDDIGIPTYIADDFDDVVLGYHNALITPDERKLNGKYLNAFMHSSYIQKYFENNASGSGQRYTLSNDTVNSIPILLPTIKEQEKIGNLFSLIDRKIALNKKMNQKLEAMAKRLYDYWFVQFDFPDKNGLPYKTTGGPMTYNPTLKREIPAGWEVSTLANFAEYVKTTTKFDKAFNYVSTDNMLAEKQGLSGEILKPASGNVLCYEKNDILISNIRPYFKKIWYADQSGTCSTDVLCVRSLNPDNSYFVYRTLWQDDFFDYVMQGAKGSKMPRGDKTRIMNYPICIAKENFDELIKKFSALVVPMQAVIQKNTRENTCLTKLRDKLLPLLMNGQVTVA
ncbi:restriction endonuclease subunit S [Candidatus Saccharibacteria bacterium]|nr:restriction endonuclease subunit S [Candidatus Saccharibacteria bacterium]